MIYVIFCLIVDLLLFGTTKSLVCYTLLTLLFRIRTLCTRVVRNVHIQYCCHVIFT